jgi:site-specific DNA-methyltransferase (adenine-specific)
MALLPDSSIDAIVTDPPYGLGFMGKAWDDLPPGLPWAQECLRVLKPGGHLLAFGGTRTWHRLACAVEDAGFEMRDSIAWLYGSGFPKSLDVSKAIDKAAGAEREIVGLKTYGEGQTFTGSAKGGRSAGHMGTPVERGPSLETAPATEAAQQWQGWGTALKPAFEPVVVARKPLVGTVAANVQQWGTGALNIDGCRIGMSDADRERLTDWHARYGGRKYADGSTYAKGMGDIQPPNPSGRWPANVVLDESSAAELDEQSGYSKSPPVGSVANKAPRLGQVAKGDEQARISPNGHGDSGGASRFMYVAKAPKSERPVVDGTAHPTVKPLALMRWLVRLVTPPGGLVLDPFAGSGTTVEAALLEGFDVVGVEREADYLPLINARISRTRKDQA